MARRAGLAGGLVAAFMMISRPLTEIPAPARVVAPASVRGSVPVPFLIRDEHVRPVVRASRDTSRAPLPADVLLERIMRCESGGNPTARNPTSSASGLFQALHGTWGGYGGYPEAWMAPVDVQWAHAHELYALRGTQPWDASRFCWSRR
jgi:hypothetical protein